MKTPHLTYLAELIESPPDFQSPIQTIGMKSSSWRAVAAEFRAVQVRLAAAEVLLRQATNLEEKDFCAWCAKTWGEERVHKLDCPAMRLLDESGGA